MKELEVTVVAENTVRGGNLKAEHGLALWINFGKRKFLFDTGQGLVLEHNLKKLKLDPSELDGVILSHGHYDHVDGLPNIVDQTDSLTVYCHPRIFRHKAVRSSCGEYRDIGRNWHKEELEKRGAEFVFNRGPAEIAEGVVITGEIVRENDFEDTGGDFCYNMGNYYEADSLPDDQALILDNGSGPVAVLGCGHSGVINTLDQVSSVTGKKELRALIGGLHLNSADRERIARTIEHLKEYKLEKIVPLHCTGLRAVIEMAQCFPDIFQEGSTGDVFKF